MPEVAGTIGSTVTTCSLVFVPPEFRLSMRLIRWSIPLRRKIGGCSELVSQNVTRQVVAANLLQRL